MGRLRSTGTRRLLRVLALSAIAIGGLATWALATGAGGWDHLGDGGIPGSDSLNAAVYALHETPGALYVGGPFTNAGGKTGANRIASWNGSSWSALSSSTAPAAQISNGAVFAIAAAGGKVYAGGNFQDAGGNPDADFLAVWDGAHWAPFCNVMAGTATRAFNGNVVALQVIGTDLYVGGSFQDGAGLVSADYLLRCNLNSGASTTTVVDPNHPFSGSVYALTADSSGTLYAGGLFINLENDDAADKVASLDGDGWHSMGSGAPSCGGCAVAGAVRSLAAKGTDVYVGTDSTNVAGIPKADHVVRWTGSGWQALGENTAGDNGWFPTSATIDGLATFGSNVFATGSFQNANGDGRADAIAFFDGNAWHAVGSDGAGNGPLNPSGSALALFDRVSGVPSKLYVGGSFTTAGGDPQAHSVASFALNQLIAVATPTVTAGPSAVATPTVTPSPTATAPPDVKPPRTLLRRAQINQAKRKATFRFASSERGSKFLCKLDKKKYKPCTSPKTYKKLKRGKHVFRVKARDRAGNVDKTPMVKRFRIKRPGSG